MGYELRICQIKKVGAVTVKVLLCFALPVEDVKKKKNGVKSVIHWAEHPVTDSFFSPMIQHAESAECLPIRSIKTAGAGHDAKTTAAERQSLTARRQPGGSESF